MPEDLPFFVGSQGAICGQDVKKTAIKPFANFATPISGAWTGRMVENTQLKF